MKPGINREVAQRGHLPAIRSLLGTFSAESSPYVTGITLLVKNGALCGPVTGVGSLCVRWWNLCAECYSRS